MSYRLVIKGSCEPTHEYLRDPSLQNGVKISLYRSFEFRHVLSHFGQGDTWVHGSYIVSITDTCDKIAKFISTHNNFFTVCLNYKYGSLL